MNSELPAGGSCQNITRKTVDMQPMCYLSRQVSDARGVQR
jgi:hypothetical protein